MFGLFVAMMLLSAGASTLLEGEFHSGQGVGQHVIIQVEGLQARIIGVLFVGLGSFVAVRSVQRARSNGPSGRVEPQDP